LGLEREAATKKGKCWFRQLASMEHLRPKKRESNTTSNIRYASTKIRGVEERNHKIGSKKGSGNPHRGTAKGRGLVLRKEPQLPRGGESIAYKSGERKAKSTKPMDGEGVYSSIQKMSVKTKTRSK